MPGDRRRGPRGLRRVEETLQARVAAEAVMDEAARQDATLAATEAPLPQYFATDHESSSDDEDFMPALEPDFRVRRTHDDEAGCSSLPGQREVESPVPRSQLHRCLSRTSSLLLDHGRSDSGHTPGTATDAGSLSAVPGVSAGGTEAVDAPAPDDDLSYVHIHVCMPRSALSAVRDLATSATDHCPALG
jgi:hypothetical protein